MSPQGTERISKTAQVEAGMALPRIVVRGKKVILLSGYTKDDSSDDLRKDVVVDAKDKLVRAAKRDPDAVAFGYIAGEWVASA